MTPPLLRPVRPDDVKTRRGCAVDPDTLAASASIIRDITERGDPAVLDHAVRLGDVRAGETVLVSRPDLRAALDHISSGDRELLERTAERIGRFADAQRSCLRDLSLAIPGGHAGHTCLPVRTVGCYAPGGRFPLPSSVLMTAVTARVAGVEEVWVASPRPTPLTLAAAAVAGVAGLLAIGGVQAIAAMARGLVGVPPCDMIVGPGNRWVTAAKQHLSGEVGIDMLAGPSELVVLADESADAGLIASDLLAQAEHDDDAVPILISTCPKVVANVEIELGRQLVELPTRASATYALRNGFVVLADSTDQAVAICDRIGPEHLEIHMKEAAAIAASIRNAGAVFVGTLAAEVLGDYGAGPNHVLPTGGTSRYRAGLSVFTFLRARTWMSIYDLPLATPVIEDAAALARMERLAGHASSAERRIACRAEMNAPDER